MGCSKCYHVIVGGKRTRKWTARQMLRLLYSDGWRIVRQTGSHAQLRHPTKPGRVTVPVHARVMDPGTIASILRQAGLKE